MAASSLLALLPACEPKRPLRIAAHVWPGYEPLFLAQEREWINHDEVRLIETRSATESMQQLANGMIDGAALTLDEVLRARAMGLPLSAVLVFDISAGADVLLSRPQLQKIPDLKGKRIGFEQGAVGDLMFSIAMKTNGLNLDAVKQIHIPIDEHLNAWKSGAVDALITYEPVSTRIVAEGGIRLFDSRKIPDTIVDVLAIRNDRLEAHHANAIRGLLTAHLKALSYINTNPQDASYRMAPRLGLPPEQVLTTFRGLVLPNLENNRRLLIGNPPQLMEGVQRISTLIGIPEMHQENLLSGEYLDIEVT